MQFGGQWNISNKAKAFPDSPPLLDTQQINTLLSAIEDLQTVDPRVYAQCEEVYFSCIKSHKISSTPLQLSQTLKNDVSNLTASSSGGFSMIGSMLLESATSDGIGSASGVRHDTVDDGADGPVPKEGKRQWDWRKGIQKDSRGSDVLRILRLGLARELARIWVDGTVR